MTHGCDSHDLNGRPAAWAALRDVAFGSIAGVCGKIVEFPADTVKVRLQSQPMTSDAGRPKLYTGSVDCFRKIVHKEGVRGLYKGLASPLIGAVLENATLFVSYNAIQNAIRSNTDADPDVPLTLPQLFTAGALAGTVASFLLTPIELVKCKLQVQEMGHQLGTGFKRHYTQPSAPRDRGPACVAAAAAGQHGTHSSTPAITKKPVALASICYRGPIDVIRHTYATHGVRGFYRGHVGTMLRETGGSAAWFGVYEVAIQQFIRSRGASSKADLAVPELLAAGALAGVSYNVVLFPADVIKSRQQTAEELAAAAVARAQRSGNAHAVAEATRAAKEAARAGFLAVGRNLYRAEGWAGLYRGCWVTVVKSTPTSAVIFGVYEMLNRWL
ncbi:hypothetical protein AMAG_14186 [Allomyces macrogynus ATCC 38327]|uniref:Uncharacterized protein n=1 Tax=Allomyces macrogynus (strain ATCC 38327) TaxID=578462 RepID=A0A0L0T4J5_ALLM3|nr:hypothetical protein AMAG_14186 [Allomyces macrogynus ATCC 38327]|eukprot:KNE69631.1 hypothetical protein AMAG_14186 [Allomyces macrogynus ATCC 38327]